MDAIISDQDSKVLLLQRIQCMRDIIDQDRQRIEFLTDALRGCCGGNVQPSTGDNLNFSGGENVLW